MSKTIEPRCAGVFYPADEQTLRSTVTGLLRSAAPPPCRPKAIIVPHAGYDYSGPIAAAGFACLAARTGAIQRVVLLGTCHVQPTTQLLTTRVDAIVTPLGPVPIDTAAVEQAARLPQVTIDDQAHARDHAVAVQLPLLQITLRGFQVVPFLVGTCDAAEVAEVIEFLWGGSETLLVVSSDLSHYLTYEQARRHDQRTAEAIVRGDPEAIGPDDVCGHPAIAGLLLAARRHRPRIRQVDLRNSGDTAGGRDRVVGYGAFVLEEEDGDVP